MRGEPVDLEAEIGDQEVVAEVEIQEQVHGEKGVVVLAEIAILIETGGGTQGEGVAAAMKGEVGATVVRAETGGDAGIPAVASLALCHCPLLEEL